MSQGLGRLALGITGAAFGGLIGAPNLGFLVGSTLGGAIFGGSSTTISTEGPRLDDQSVTTSTYGKPVNKAWGSVRLAGNMIWATDLVEESTTRTTGGGGGKGFGGGGTEHERTTYEYFANFAVAFAEGEADAVARIWANSDLIYDASSESAVQKDIDLNFRFYPGSEDQEPDPMIVDEQGEDVTPAHRGICYIVFERLPLQKFGNRIPNIHAEISFDASEANSWREVQLIQDEDQGGTLPQLHADFKRNRLYFMGTGSGYFHYLRVYNLSTLERVRRVLIRDNTTAPDFFDGYATTDMSLIHVGSITGSLYFQFSRQVTAYANHYKIVRVEKTSLTEVGSFYCEQVLAAAEGFSVGVEGQTAYLATLEGPGDVRIYKFSGDMETVFERVWYETDTGDASDKSNIVFGGLTGGSGLRGAVFWYILENDPNDGNDNSLTISKFTVTPTISKGLFGYSVETEVNAQESLAVISPDVWGGDDKTDEDFSSEIVGTLVDPEDNALIFFINKSLAGDAHAIKWNESAGIIWNLNIPDVDLASPDHSFNENNFKYGEAILFGRNDVILTIDTRTGTVKERLDLTDAANWENFDPPPHPPVEARNWVFDSVTKSVVTANSVGSNWLRQIYLGRVYRNEVEVSTILRDLSEEAGLDPDTDVDVSQIDQHITGYIIQDQQEVREGIEPLAKAFLFEGVEIDNQMVFVPRGQSPDRTITESEMAFQDDNGAVVSTSRTQEVELPERVIVRYKDVSLDHQVGSQTAKRIQAPRASMRSNNEITVDLNIAMYPDLARQIAERLLFLEWAEREKQSFTLDWRHVDLVPSDVINVVRDDGLTSKLRITNTESSPSLQVSVEARREESALVTSEAEGAQGLGFRRNAPVGTAVFRPVYLDVPLLRDSDRTGGSVSNLLVSTIPFNEAFRGGTVYESDGGGNFDSTGERILESAIGGSAIGSLEPTNLPFQTDTESVVDVVLEKGELASVNDSQFLDGENAALVGNSEKENWEVVLFKNATQIDEWTWRLDTFIRGLRGTDVNVNTHESGETFIFLQPEFFAKVELELSDLDGPRFYKVVADQNSSAEAQIAGHVHKGRDLMPYAPVHLDAIRDDSDNVNLSWERRTRVGGVGLRAQTSKVPLSEESEQYEVDILDGPDGEVVRTLESTTTNVQYGSTDVTSDFGSVPSEITFVVYQISAAVGRGFPQKTTVTL